jgi:hypothetical protein
VQRENLHSNLKINFTCLHSPTKSRFTDHSSLSLALVATNIVEEEDSQIDDHPWQSQDPLASSLVLLPSAGHQEGA